MATMFSTGVPKAVLFDRYRITPVETITLPRPVTRELTYPKESVTLQFLNRRIEEHHLGFRPTLVLKFMEVDTQANLDNVLKVARWGDKIEMTPFSDLPPMMYFMQVAKDGVKIENIGDKSLNQAITITLVATNLIPAIPILDEFYLGIKCMSGDVKNAGGDDKYYRGYLYVAVTH